MTEQSQRMPNQAPPAKRPDPRIGANHTEVWLRGASLNHTEPLLRGTSFNHTELLLG